MYAETAQRDNFIIRPIDYYRDAWGSFVQSGLAQPLLAEVEGETVAGLILFRFADRAWYMYGMSRNAHREKMPNYLLQWEAMRWAKTQGCTVYDLWGAPDELNEADSMWGVYKFKEGLGATFAPHVGAYDFVVSRLGYWLYTTAMPRVLNLMRRRHQSAGLT
jgi:lipid II:glycine glycyltransferase (peptidoglycan interpeptide bridge formation enzyme)